MKAFLQGAVAPALIAGWIWQAPGAWGQSIRFTAAPVLPAGILPTSVAAGDFNGDGKPDLAVTNQKGVSIRLNGLPGVDYTDSSLTNPVSVAVGDFNGDGKLDLAVVKQTPAIVSVMLGNGDGTFAAAADYPAGTRPQRVVVADVNGDGKADLVVVDRGFGTGSGITVLLGNGNGSFQAPAFFPAGSVAVSVAVGDFNSDGKADLAVANVGSGNLSVLIGNGNGTFQPAVNIDLNLPGISVSPTSVVAGDFNLDGKLDLAVSTPDVKNIAVLLGIGNGAFQAPVHYGLDDPNFANADNTLATADLNGDGKPDLVLVNLSANHLTVLLGAGDGTFPSAKSYAAGPEPIGVAVADFDGDGKPDLAVADNADDGTVSLLLGNGDGTLQAPPLYRSASIPTSLAVGDLNGDGKLDVVAASTLSPIGSGIGSGVTMLGNGDGTFQPPAIWTTSGATSVALGDFNGDGKLDLAETIGGSSGNVSVLLGKGDGTFQSPVAYSAGSAPQAVAVADLNGDGKLDLVVANHNSFNVSVLLGAGNGTFLPAANSATPLSGTADSVAVADFNGDGKPDLAVAISGVNATLVSILLGNGNGTFQLVTSVPLGFHSPGTLSVVAADFNGDGAVDFAVTDGTTLSVVMGNGNASFQVPVTYPLVASGRAIVGVLVVGDFNGDNKPDLAVTTRDGISVFSGNGDGSFSLAVGYAPFLGGAVAVGDFDGDGRPDLVAADSVQDATGTDTVAILLNSSVVPVPVTIASVPTGLEAVVDNVPCNTPCNLTLNWGTLHGIDVFAYQQPFSPVGTRYAFVSWSDGGGLGHNIRVPRTPVTYTASFKTQYQFAIAASPAGGGTATVTNPTLIDLGGFIDSGTVVPILATPAGGYSFAGWAGNVANASNPSTTVTMSGPQSVTANFALTNPVGLLFVPVTPCRVLDTRLAVGTFGGPAISGNSSRDFAVPSSACNIPSAAQAYSLNVTVVPPGPLTYLTVWPTGQTQPFVSTLNSFDGRVVANAAIVPAGTNGSISIFVSDTTHVIVDINGYFAPVGGLSFYPVAPCRVADTRGNGLPQPFGQPSMGANETRTFPLPQGGCNVPPSAQAYSLNVTVVPSGPLGYLTTWPAQQNQPFVSTLNSLDGSVVANAAIVPAGANGGISVFVTDPTGVILDINGYFAPPGGAGALSFHAVSPCRVVDTRPGQGPSGQFGPPGMIGNAARNFGVPQGTCAIPPTAQAYALNVTVVPPGPLGYLTAWPAGQTQPLVSTLNSYQGKVVANAAIVPAGQGGAISVFVTDPTDLILDVNGYFAQ